MSSWEASSRADARIERLFRLSPEAREQQIAELITSVVRPLVERVVERYTGPRAMLPEPDGEDVVSSVTLRLLVKLRSIAEGDDDVIRSLDDYAAMLAYNAVRDQLRRRYPQRARARNRVRYVLTHTPRLALWSAGDRLLGGLAGWKGIAAAGDPTLTLPEPVLRRMSDGTRAADDLILLFEQVGRPVPFDLLVELCAERWRMIDAAPTLPIEPSAEPVPLGNLELRERFDALWREIVQLRPMQRKALLLNLRGIGMAEVAGLLDSAGIAGMAALARALEMTEGELAAIWNDLPLDDLRIAAMLQLTRPQVISLRRSARERLTRRLASEKAHDRTR